MTSCGVMVAPVLLVVEAERCAAERKVADVEAEVEAESLSSAEGDGEVQEIGLSSIASKSQRVLKRTMLRYLRSRQSKVVRTRWSDEGRG